MTEANEPLIPLLWDAAQLAKQLTLLTDQTEELHDRFPDDMKDYIRPLLDGLRMARHRAEVVKISMAVFLRKEE